MRNAYKSTELLAIDLSSLTIEPDRIDQEPGDGALLDHLASLGLTRIGVPEGVGGSGGSAADAVEAIAALAERSLTASFVLWSHRCFTEFVLQSPNQLIKERELPALLAGRRAGAAGLSNAMKFLGGIETMEVGARPLEPSGSSSLRWRVNGMLPWVTNLRRRGFSVAAAAQLDDGTAMPVFAFRSSQQGVDRSADLDLVGLRGSDVAAIKLTDAVVGADDLLHKDLESWLPSIRPQFLAFLCGMSIGLARAGSAAAREEAGARIGLRTDIQILDQALQADYGSLLTGLDDGRFKDAPQELFKLRLCFAEHVRQALSLELQSWGGRAYLAGKAPGFARRWRESTFIPVITPSLVQLNAQISALAMAEG